MTVPSIATDPVTVQVSGSVLPILSALGKGAQILIYNNDITNVAYAGYRNGLTQANAIPVQPLASVTIPAERQLFAFCPTASVALTLAPNGTNISPSPAQVAQQLNTLGLAKDTSVNALPGTISTTGVPLLNNTALLDNTNAVITAGNSVVLPSSITEYSVTQPGYEVLIACHSTAEAYLQVLMTWFDIVSGLVVSSQSWWLSPGPAAGSINRYIGTGPTHGNQLQVTLAAVTGTVTVDNFTIEQNSRIYARDDWRSTQFNGAVTYFSPLVNPISLVLGHFGPGSVGAGVSLNRLLPLFAGKIRLHAGTNSHAADLNVIITNVADQTPAGSAVLYQESSNANGFLDTETSLPRSNCQIALVNNNAGAQNLQFLIVIEEY
jgi:hypothetical protein